MNLTRNVNLFDLMLAATAVMLTLAATGLLAAIR
jgi:hypothetical protein